MKNDFREVDLTINWRFKAHFFQKIKIITFLPQKSPKEIIYWLICHKYNFLYL